MYRKSDKEQKYYLSDRIKKKLTRISLYPLTVVSAPSGFGKTTSIREYLEYSLPYEACKYWYTCLGESASMFWTGICGLFSNINDKVAQNLKNLGMPCLDTLYYMITYLRNINCDKDTYIIVDNYQLVNCDIHSELMHAFSMHMDPRMHIVFITQNGTNQSPVYNDNIHIISSSAFLFDRDGIKNLFQMNGIRLTKDEVEKLYVSTGGWVAAIRLQMLSFMETGSFTLCADIEQLVENAIWNRLDQEERDFLLSISVLDSFTMRQATIMLDQEYFPNKIYMLLKNNDFIKYLPGKFYYSIHTILLNYLRNRFRYLTSDDYKNLIYKKAGKACSADFKYWSAAEFYYRIGDFDAILSLPFTREYLDEQKERYRFEFFAALIRECPDDILCSHHSNMIVFGYMALMNGYRDEYKRLCRLLFRVIQNGIDFSQEQLTKIKGEYILLKSLGKFNDITQMIEGQYKYWDLVGQPTGMINTDTPWLFGSTSVLSMFWREEGQLKDVLRQIDAGSALYHKLAMMHGAGAFYAMEAEMMLMAGKDDEAEISCHKALNVARIYKQDDICLCAELILARIAILRGDAEAYFKSVENIRNYSNENSRLYIIRMVEHCISTISFVLDEEEHVSTWLYDMESIKKTVYFPIIPQAQILHLWLLLRKKRYNEFYAVCEQALILSDNPVGNIRYLLPKIYQLIFLAVAKRNNGKYLEAQAHLKEAFTIAFRDEIYLPFAQHECMVQFLPEINTSFYDGIDMPGSDSFVKIMELCKRQRRGVGIIKRAIIGDKSPLTPREREIALLAKDRFSSKEIAAKLYISEMTVRTTLKSIYRKLGIHSRSELYLKEF